MNRWITIGGIAGFLGVALGAFGAHALKSSLSPDMISVYQTGVLYHLIHAVVITALGLSGRQAFAKSALFFTIGIVLFSFSLYGYSVTGIKFLAIITPLGGISFLIAWLLLILSAKKL